MMNNNIRTMKRVRHTHAKFAALNLNGTNNDDPEGGGSGENTGFGNTFSQGSGVQDDEGIGVLDDKVDERPWGVQVKGKRHVRGIEMGENNTNDCMRWMSGKVLEHAGFQGMTRTLRLATISWHVCIGTSEIALDVLASVASEYLLNVGRTIRYLCDRYSNSMTPEVG
jgi:transcriptional activator SPT7